ncbi:acyl-CoA thioesterase [Croceivirga thetidis]|uniref:Acyl-CoA thioesterase n=1 Tax=Croceivirga thetidis TaxID=2721623 RepID=A0ABX1GRF1_9FLAO|nr:acyl-CoA thioesterase [Croceivirga thetidis]NKI32527.1 acyl-CoA thioesterase [Croceivirga thetidis]
MNSYSKLIYVSKDDLDELNHVNNIRYIEWIQEISREHWQNAVSKDIANSCIWVVRNHNITYHKSAVLNDELNIRTYVKQWHGVISTRFVEIKNNKTDVILVTSHTEWCMLDSKSFKPKRVTEEIIRQFE